MAVKKPFLSKGNMEKRLRYAKLQNKICGSFDLEEDKKERQQ